MLTWLQSLEKSTIEHSCEQFLHGMFGLSTSAHDTMQKIAEVRTLQSSHPDSPK